MTQPRFDFEGHLDRQREWSARTFGPGARAKGCVAHIRKELVEVESDPGDLTEWIDVVILALDGAWRSGASPAEIIAALVAKQDRNERRQWPDWRLVPEDQPIEHAAEAPAGAASVRGVDVSPAAAALLASVEEFRSAPAATASSANLRVPFAGEGGSCRG